MAIDVPNLLQPISPEAPCGENLEYDADCIALELASQGKPEQQYGDTRIPAEPPDWKEVMRLGEGLLARTKDLRIACHVARAVLEVRQVDEFADVLRLLQGYVSDYWDTVHPQLDPDDDNDPTWRVNTLSSLNDLHSTIQSLRNAILVDAGVLGRFSLQDVETARGEVSATGDDPPTMASIDAAFQQSDGAALQKRAVAIQDAIDQLGPIETNLTSLVGANQACNFERLRGTLQSIQTLLERQLNRLGLNSSSPPDNDEFLADQVNETQPVITAPMPVTNVQTAEIQSREDVVKTLDRLCDYYEKHEPSSPLPLLLRRAQRLASMSFIDIIKDLTPEGLTQAKSISGVDEVE